MTLSIPAVGDETVAGDEADLTAAFIEFLKAASLKRHPSGSMPRFNQARAAGCVEGEFIVLPDLPDDLRVGLFAAARTYPAWIRFANAASATDREKDIRGMSIRIADVEGENLTPGATVQDFVLNSHPVMMSSDARAFMQLLEANEAGGLKRALFFLTHPKAAAIALASRQNPTCHLDIPYWSATPYRFGPGRAVKYKVAPATPERSRRPASLSDTYLGDELRSRLGNGAASFDFLVQLQTDSRRMPVEDASTEWKESESPFRRVASVRIPTQDADDEGRRARCERMVFNPWHCLPDHRPLGSMNRARRAIYEAMGQFRVSRG